MDFPIPSKERIDQIASWLSETPGHFGPTAADRAAWLPYADTPEAKKIIAQAESVVGTPIPELPDEITFVTSQELEDAYPELSPKEREYRAARKYGAVFLMGIGGKLRSGEIHDGRAPDYDDWNLNGDIFLYDPLLDIALEVSSMGIRVNPESLRRQLKERGCEERAELPFQKALLNGELPQTIGGGIGQSRMCVYLLRKAHVGEVQASIWPDDVAEACRKANIHLL